MSKDTAFDLYVVTKPPEQTRNLQIFSLGGVRTIGIKGFYKTILQFLKCLLTLPGSDVSDTTYGTVLGGMIGNNVGSYQDLADAIGLSVQAATDKIKEYQNLTNPLPRETLASATVTSIQPTAERTDVYIRLTNVAGETLTLMLPADIRAPVQST